MTDCERGEICMRRNSRNLICLERVKGYAKRVYSVGTNLETSVE